MTDTQKNNIREWVAELRSGKRKQCTRYLHVERNDTSEYCCLGVACEIANLSSNKSSKTEHHAYEFLFPSGLSLAYTCDQDWFMDRFGFEALHRFSYRNYSESTLANLNDAGVTFEEIADLIEKEFLL